MSSLPATSLDVTDGLPRSIRVLVLDDQRFDRHKLCRLCSGLPISCDMHQADCLAAFGTRLGAEAFDLIFVDYALPDGSGIDALDMIRASPRNSGATSIMVTSFDEESISHAAMTRGCADYITKDELSANSLERAVINALQKSMLSAQVQSQTYAREEVERVLTKFANQCVGDIKPLVSRMIRQLRSLRETPSSDPERINEHRASVEASCLHLWELLEALEQQHADVMMKDLTALSTTPNSAPSPRAKNFITKTDKRPPSPFSRSQ